MSDDCDHFTNQTRQTASDLDKLKAQFEQAQAGFLAELKRKNDQIVQMAKNQEQLVKRVKVLMHEREQLMQSLTYKTAKEVTARHLALNITGLPDTRGKQL